MNHATSSHDDAAAVALRGASLAFLRKSPGPSTPQPHKGSSENEALTAAATSADRARSPARGRTLGEHTNGNGVSDAELYSHQGSVVAARLHQLNANSSAPQLQPGTTHSGKVDQKSPSFIAATLAASRSASPSPNTRTPRRVGSLGTMSVVSAGDAVDSEPIPPTGSLISMFEQGRRNGDPVKKLSPKVSPGEASKHRNPEQRRHSPATTPARPSVKVPKPDTTSHHSTPAPSTLRPETERRSVRRSPRRSPSPLPTDNQQPESATAQSRSRHRSPLPAVSRTKPEEPPSKLLYGLPVASLRPDSQPTKQPRQPNSSDVSGKSSSTDVSSKPRAPTPPPVVRRSTTEVLSPKPKRIVKPPLQDGRQSQAPLSMSVYRKTNSPGPRKHSPQPKARPPTPPKPRGSHRLEPSHQTSNRGRSRGQSDSRVNRAMASVYTSSSNGTPSPARSIQPGDGRSPPALPRRRESIASAPSSPTRGAPRRRLTNASASQLQLDHLTSAIVAGSLAASRLTPHHTGSSLPPPALPKRQKSPRLLQTLRQPASHTEEDQDPPRKGHRHKLHTGKHAHHEGSRKRWREEMTERERKRYEAVWASNRGQLLADVDPSASVASGLGKDNSECVVNVVVREVWKRSRLPEDELVEVWDLVDRDDRGVLNRQEFVVGLWLIDQRLRGRKLPQRVSDSVWGSANGVRLKKPKR